MGSRTVYGVAHLLDYEYPGQHWVPKLVTLWYTSLETQRCQGYSRRLPALSCLPAIKVYPLNLESQNQAKNIPVGLSSSQIKIWGKSVQGFLSYDRTDKQSLQLYMYR